MVLRRRSLTRSIVARSIADGLGAVIVGEGLTEGVLLGTQRLSGLLAYYWRRLHLCAYAVAIVAASGYMTDDCFGRFWFGNCFDCFTVK